MRLYQVNAEERQTGWNAGSCSSCGQLQAVRIVNREAVSRVVGIETKRKVQSISAVCDFCERPVERTVALDHVPVDVWGPQLELPELLSLLETSEDCPVPPRYTEQSLNSMLSATRRATAIYRCGSMFGFIVAFVAALALSKAYGFSGPKTPEQVSTNRMLGLLSLVLFMVVFLIFALFKRERIARAKINRAFDGYQPDIDLLSNLAYQYSGPIRRAVSKIQQRIEKQQAAQQRVHAKLAQDRRPVREIELPEELKES